MGTDEGLLFVVAMGVVLIVLALVSDAALQRWRLAAAAAATFGAANFALSAIGGGHTEMAKHFPPEAVLLMRCVSGLGVIWAAYLGIDQVVIWWRVGDKAED